MTDELPVITLKVIGSVRNKVKDSPPGASAWWVELVSEIVIDPALSEALDGLEDFSHIIVLFWMHRVTGVEIPLKVHPMLRQELPLTGIFATRAPVRPNRIGVTAVRLLERQGNILRVKGLDALDGSPVIDIKPYIPVADTVADARVPRWVPTQ
ncbi:MAG: tRNA (N6-threonylcarbamoyladenosine(37)-N6)-methyltransferase TrmO [Dehalococcoidales bacterium]|nr:tRNA (N6-threonylcarbamoyladenosine(37)-N6)-methyltransferase TrmO [Dehalococcoidales bacterium]